MSGWRRPAVAGQFYPGEAAELQDAVRGYLPDVPAAPHLALIAPHAGYMYSGAIAGAAYAACDVPERVIVLGPNHRGVGAKKAIWASGAWQFPGFDVEVDEDLARDVMTETMSHDDNIAQQFEHSLEVHIPFLVARRADVRIAPICLSRLRLDECLAFGKALARVCGRVDTTSESRPLIVASTDFSHYIDARSAQRLDGLAIERITAMDPEGLYRVVFGQEISMCGVIPVVVALAAARELHAHDARLVEYGNSGQISGDLESVVGYASLLTR
jgi:MEMO1 family protein